MWEQILSLIDRSTPSLLMLFGVWLGWKLNSHSQWKQNRLDRLADSFNALRKIRHVVENVPPDLEIGALRERLTEDKLRKGLSEDFVRLFGLRTELIPFLDSDIVDFIDNHLRPLYIIQTGTYEFREERVAEFAASCLQLRALARRVENRLSEEYEELRK